MAVCDIIISNQKIFLKGNLHMKKFTKVLAIVLALIFVLSLVACGGEKNPADDDPKVTTKAPNTTKKPTTTRKPITTRPAVTTKPVVLTTTILEDATVETPVADPFANSTQKAADYYALYVDDGLIMHLNFAEVNSSTPAIFGGDFYNDPTVSAATRFNGVPANYNPFVIKGLYADQVSGGTAKIIAPWWFEDYYSDGYILNGGGTSSQSDLSNKRTTPPLDASKIIKEIQVGDSTIYVTRTESFDERYYVGNGEWCRVCYVSQWGNGFLSIGKQTQFNYLVGSYKEGPYVAMRESGAYTIEFSMRFPEITKSGAYTRFFTGAKFQLCNDRGNYRIVNEGTAGYLVNDGAYSVTMEDVNPIGINTLAFTYNTANASEAGKVIAGVTANGKSYLNQELTAGSMNASFCMVPFKGMDIDIFSIRVYTKALTAEEALQNHFADIAIICKLDITNFLKLDDAAKLNVYKAFEGRSATEGKTTLQAVLDSVAK